MARYAALDIQLRSTPTAPLSNQQEAPLEVTEAAFLAAVAVVDSMDLSQIRLRILTGHSKIRHLPDVDSESQVQGLILVQCKEAPL